MPAIIPYEVLFSERDYLAPTVYKKAGIGIISGWNYYGTVNEAIVKYKYLNNLPGGANVTPEGSIKFLPDTTAQTLGINVDFYILSGGKWVPATYKYLRGLLTLPPIVFRFYTTQGAGPYYAIYDSASFGMSATSIQSASPEKIAALDSFYREVQLLKYRYNSLAAFLNDLSKRVLTSQEQQIYNEGVLKLQNLQAQINTIKGIEIVYSQNGQIVGLPILLIIAVIAILAAATAWTITTIISMKEKTRQINDSYQLQQWVADKKIQVAQLAQAGTISQADANKINGNLDSAAASAEKVAENASKPGTSIFGDIASIVKWGAIGFIAMEGFKAYKTKKTQ